MLNLSIYDVVHENVNFRHAFTGINNKLRLETIAIPTVVSNVNFLSPLCSTLAIRTAIRMLYLERGFYQEAYGDIIKLVAQSNNSESLTLYSERLRSGIQKESILLLASLMNKYKPEDFSLLSKINIKPVNDHALNNENEFVSAVEFLIDSIARFESIYGQLPLKECEFQGAYNDIVTSSYCGMPMFRVDDTLWLFETMSHGKKWQIATLLTAYVMGMHSTSEEYHSIRYLATYFPLTGEIERIDVYELKTITFKTVCERYIGYQMEGKKDWRFSSGTDPDRYESAKHYHVEVLSDFKGSLDIEEVAEGVTEIPFSVYQNFYETTIDPAATISMKPKSIQTIYLVKKSPYFMFLGSGEKGLYLLHGGKRTLLNHGIEYYSENLSRYALSVENLFSQYWSIQDVVSSAVKKIYRNRDWNTGRIHGCIVDIDGTNHVYINPFDGCITVYYAESTSSRIVYRMTDKFHERLPNYEFDSDADQNSHSKSTSMVKLLPKDGCYDGIELIWDDSTIYSTSRYFSNFRLLHDKHIVIYWEDSLIESR